TSTEARKSYDGMTSAFGVGANGPLLVSVDMSQQPAKPDQTKLDKVSKQEYDQKAQANQKAQAQEASLEAKGVPPAQAQAQGQPQLDKQLKEISDKASAQRKQLDQNATDPRLSKLRTDIEHAGGVKKVTQPLV